MKSDSDFLAPGAVPLLLIVFVLFVVWCFVFGKKKK
jgi:hypothetical protein